MSFIGATEKGSSFAPGWFLESEVGVVRKTRQMAQAGAVDGVTGENKKYVDPVEEWKTEKDKSGIWTISIGTVFVKDRVVLPDATRTVLELGYDDVYQVTKVDKLDFGGIPHFEVGGN